MVHKSAQNCTINSKYCLYLNCIPLPYLPPASAYLSESVHPYCDITRRDLTEYVLGNPVPYQLAMGQYPYCDNTRRGLPLSFPVPYQPVLGHSTCTVTTLGGPLLRSPVPYQPVLGQYPYCDSTRRGLPFSTPVPKQPVLGQYLNCDNTRRASPQLPRPLPTCTWTVPVL